MTALAWLVPVAFPLLASPASLAAAVACSSRFGLGVSLGAIALVAAAAIAALAAGERLARPAAALAIANRFLGALLVTVAVEMLVDGVRSV